MGKLRKRSADKAAAGWGKTLFDSDDELEYDSDDDEMPDLEGEEDFVRPGNRASPIYTPLKPPEIRLFSMDSTAEVTDKAEIVLSVENYPISEAPPFSALSYWWGNPATTAPLHSKRNALPITDNLNTALRRLRTIQQRDRIQFWWVDAICSYSCRTVMQHLRILRFAPLFYEGVNYPERHIEIQGDLTWPPSDRLNMPLGRCLFQIRLR
ncbi:hypothetical protein AYO22_01561 [Fonsecaea multimorphosa]|nr:hypothetical protein AYO22_01561 [Fonsecaea multimorphosa]